MPSAAPHRPIISVPPASQSQRPFLVVSLGGTTLIVGEATRWTVIDLPRPPTKEDQEHLLAHGIPPWVAGRPATKTEITAALKEAIKQTRRVADGEAEMTTP